ncbi:MAG: 4-(cytidine 5'-diphospho)-2-C-methyl-D-erythritol kinase [Cyanobacteria bacterium P01_H01_bin.121]
MSSCILNAPAKVNLHLEILGDRADGYHELAMVLQSINLADRITLQSSSIDRIQVRCDHPLVPNDTSNLAYRAAELMSQQFPQAFARYGGIDILIEKRIPVGAGLAGGSTNAAAVLVGVNLLWKLGLTKSELERLGATLGSDVPFCVEGGTVLATGRGEQLAPLPDLANVPVVLAKYQKLSVSTAWAYKTYRQQFNQTYTQDEASILARREQVHAGPIVGAIMRQDLVGIGQLLRNDLEKVVLPAYESVQSLRSTLATQAGVLGTMMSGSGPTVFALCETTTAAEAAAVATRRTINNPDLSVWVTTVRSEGIELAATQAIPKDI